MYVKLVPSVNVWIVLPSTSVYSATKPMTTFSTLLLIYVKPATSATVLTASTSTNVFCATSTIPSSSPTHPNVLIATTPITISSTAVSNVNNVTFSSVSFVHP